MTKRIKWLCAQQRQISLGICPVWSASSLCAQWVAKDPRFLHADSEDSDQTGQMPRLIWVFAGHTCHFVGFSWGGSIIVNHMSLADVFFSHRCFIKSPSCFVFPATTAERFFRIDRSQENLHYITDISSEDLYILDPDFVTPNRHSGFDVNGNRNSSVLKENNFHKDQDLIFTFSMPVTPPKSPG